MAVLGRSEDPALAKRFAGALAAELAAVGISLDYAPVLDIHTNPKNPVIGDRALGEKPEIVAKLGRVIIEELQRAGVAACGKHFPGHGDTATDSHVELPIVEHAPDRLRAIEFAPFKAAIDAGVAFIMTAHVLVVSIDDERPATLSPRIVQRIAARGARVQRRHRLRRSRDEGDREHVPARRSGRRGHCRRVRRRADVRRRQDADIELQGKALEALIHAVEDERLPLKRVEAALERNRQAKERFLREWRPPTAAQLRAVIGSEQHRAISEQMAEFA